MHVRRRGSVALLVWTFLIWTTRVANITEGDEPASRLVLPVLFTLFGIAAAVTLWRGDRRVVRLFAGWTLAVWLVRIVQIVLADHSGAFITVHAVLAAVSIALAVASLRETAGELELSPGSRRG